MPYSPQLTQVQSFMPQSLLNRQPLAHVCIYSFLLVFVCAVDCQVKTWQWIQDRCYSLGAWCGGLAAGCSPGSMLSQNISCGIGRGGGGRHGRECFPVNSKTRQCAAWQHWHCTYSALPTFGNSLEWEAGGYCAWHIRMMYGVVMQFSLKQHMSSHTPPQNRCATTILPGITWSWKGGVVEDSHIHTLSHRRGISGPAV